MKGRYMEPWSKIYIWVSNSEIDISCAVGLFHICTIINIGMPYPVYCSMLSYQNIIDKKKKLYKSTSSLYHTITPYIHCTNGILIEHYVSIIIIFIDTYVYSKVVCQMFLVVGYGAFIIMGIKNIYVHMWRDHIYASML